MIFGLDRKSKTFRLFSPSALCAEGFFNVYLQMSFFACYGTL